jgi:hypothetical protein
MSKIIIECHLDEEDIAEFDWDALKVQLKEMIETDTWVYVDSVEVEQPEKQRDLAENRAMVFVDGIAYDQQSSTTTTLSADQWCFVNDTTDRHIS